LAASFHQYREDIECATANEHGHPIREKLAATQVQEKAAKSHKCAFTVIHVLAPQVGWRDGLRRPDILGIQAAWHPNSG
jgi:hypothetical protein